MNRDPRKDPQPGDVVKDSTSDMTYTVMENDGESVWFYYDGDRYRNDSVTIGGWRMATDGDTVLDVAGEPDSPLVSRSDAAPEPMTIRVKRLHPDAKLPTRAHATDAGLDLHSIDTRRAFHGEMPRVFRVNTGVAVEIPKGYVGLLRDRSSMASRGLMIAGGVIDSGYAGAIIVVFHRTDDNCIDAINCGDKIAQLLIVPCLTPAVVEVDELAQSERGANGFGSSDNR